MTKYLDENGLLYLWGKLKATFLHNATEGRFTGVSTNTNTGLRTFNVPTIAEHIYYDSNKNSTLKDKIDTIVSQGGEPNTIETVKVNGTALVPDANKAVNITFTDNDTTNTTGSSNVILGSDDKMYLVGSKIQGALGTGVITYSKNDLYLDSSGKLHAGGENLNNKADKVTNATSGHLASLDANGNLTDSGVTASSIVSGYLPLSGGIMTGSITMTERSAIYFNALADIYHLNDGESLIIRSDDGVQIDTGGSDDIVLNGGHEILLNASQTTIYSDLYMRDGGVIAYDQVDRSNTKVWTTNGGMVDLTTYAPLASPALTGTPTAPTAAAGTNTTQIATTSFVNTAITNALGNFTGVSYEVVQTLPASGAAGTIYLISNSGTNPNIYDEYIYVNNGFEKIGTTDVDLTNYWSKTELVVIPNTTIDYIVTNHALPS